MKSERKNTEDSIEKAKIQIFVDDFCELTLNGNKVNSKFETNIDNIFESEISIKEGLNLFRLNIENNKANPPTLPVTGVENPYGIIFTIQIQFKGNTPN